MPDSYVENEGSSSSHVVDTDIWAKWILVFLRQLQFAQRMGCSYFFCASRRVLVTLSRHATDCFHKFLEVLFQSSVVFQSRLHDFSQFLRCEVIAELLRWFFRIFG